MPEETPAPPATLAQALAQARALGLERIDAQWLLLHALGRTDAGRAWLLAHDTDALDPAAHARFLALCQRRARGEPVAYLTGHKTFYGLLLEVDARVLDPRPDTETLVDWAREVIAPLSAPRIVDLGTGSGAIALALRQHCPGARVLAVDASADALAVARANSGRLGLPVQFAQGDWLRATRGRFDAIVSNPPYVRAQDPHLAALQHEPLQALVSGADGLHDIRAIVAQAPEHLAAGGWLLLEHGYDQAAAVRALLTARGFSLVQSRNDLAGIARCTGGQWPAGQTMK
ncbi:peptide chain release factor N(5)-glutamine methyltransferase [Verminephrobacter aporrectodeae subsp. tuberculatae]|uniref:peptide chain release factor N(5)-glutamine methyltransferase n=1 Tax=Verminephrobacter aporrectodeae TaxID=1110389 RepID=UPI002238AFF8|nr:peptide chain release factor N(5)-glutamine methyltransferase [Verminephrobacter aporrectodeae]MCW5220922.1 peptide chain release factor N(5)-glutamine methyltransferase [Verminephrobacter aporrectodeae subsp. tuberculatae]MCW5290217.1 peptide chain release factor N(5)-glutamine methyltransferase [Verminephrobacter aporrectodeae subsp. tuberculatae]MCW8197900.1 peptide chain release factor N(5)-glutamine methyltransferase [Verminephrobacter aporrectodeae subsp. tuberculatae]